MRSLGVSFFALTILASGCGGATSARPEVVATVDAELPAPPGGAGGGTPSRDETADQTSQALGVLMDLMVVADADLSSEQLACLTTAIGADPSAAANLVDDPTANLTDAQIERLAADAALCLDRDSWRAILRADIDPNHQAFVDLECLDAFTFGGSAAAPGMAAGARLALGRGTPEDVAMRVETSSCIAWGRMVLAGLADQGIVGDAATERCVDIELDASGFTAALAVEDDDGSQLALQSALETCLTQDQLDKLG